MILDLDNAQQRLNSTHNPVAEIREIKRPGNSLGRRGFGVEFQAEVAALAHRKTIREVAEKVGVSEGQVSNWKHGSTDGETLNTKLIESTERKLEGVRDTALDKLMLALGVIDEEKIEKLSVKDAAAVAESMAGIIDRTTKKVPVFNAAQVIIMAPQQKEESKFQVVEI